jgi:hypothetical protein
MMMSAAMLIPGMHIVPGSISSCRTSVGAMAYANTTMGSELRTSRLISVVATLVIKSGIPQRRRIRDIVKETDIGEWLGRTAELARIVAATRSLAILTEESILSLEYRARCSLLFSYSAQQLVRVSTLQTKKQLKIMIDVLRTINNYLISGPSVSSRRVIQGAGDVSFVQKVEKFTFLGHSTCHNESGNW